jgi:GT2 family glycosyltransferase
VIQASQHHNGLDTRPIDQLEHALERLQEEIDAAVSSPAVEVVLHAPPRTATAAGARSGGRSFGDARVTVADLRAQIRSAATSSHPVVRRGAQLVLRGSTAVRAQASAAPARAAVGDMPVAPPPERDLIDRLQQRNSVVLVIPVHNASAAVEECLRSVIENTSMPHEVLVIDDASTDPAIGPLLDEVARWPHVRVVRTPVNRGYTATINTAISLTGEDIVLLNSDTVVPEGWLQGLVIAAHHSERVATATPLSDNAGAFSAPAPGTNQLPAGHDATELARLVRQHSARAYPVVPTGNGFCLYIKRLALDYVGGFDEASFPRGYGEENDFCMRVRREGWTNVIDDTTYVLHKRSASFGSEKEELMRAGRIRLDELHPTYTADVRSFVNSADVAMVRDRVRDAFDRAVGQVPRPRLLFVLHDGSGGTPATNLDLMLSLSQRYDCYTLTARSQSLELHHLIDGRLGLEKTVGLDQPWVVTHTRRPDYRSAVLDLLLEGRFELVHIRHLMGHTLELPEVCAALSIPVVLSFHDFYLSCPTVHLLDQDDQFCGGRCTAGPGACRLSTRKMRDVPPLKHDWVHVWRRHVDAMFEHVDAFVTTSQTARSVMERSLPSLRSRRFVVIPHGRDLAHASGLAQPPRNGERLRIVFPGNIGAHKGAALIKALAELDAGRRLDLHFMGRTAPELYGVGTHHGEYRREEFHERIGDIAPSFVGVFSIWAETYCHTLTEAWAAGVPVLASDIGVLRERVSTNGGGWLIDAQDPRVAYQQVLAAAEDVREWHAARESAEQAAAGSTAEMGSEYERLYTSLLRPRVWGSGA